MKKKALAPIPAPPDTDSQGGAKDHSTGRQPRLSSKGRRKFLTGAGSVTAATIATVVADSTAQAQNPLARKCEDDVRFPFGVEPGYMASNRYMKAYKCRMDAAKMARQRPLVNHTGNGDEERYPNKIGSFTKSLPHNQLGEVDLAAYATLVRARETQDPKLFEEIRLGSQRKLTSPQAGLAMDLEGPDSHHVTLPPAPRLNSAEAAGEAVELYWMALARDVNFNDYETDPLIARATADLSALSDFRGPRDGGRVTPNSIFRNGTPGSLNGPWLSQFLTLDFNFGANFVSQKMRSLAPGLDYMTSYQDWLDVQNGVDTTGNAIYDPTPHYIRNLRDMAAWVRVDALFQAYLHACLIMIEQGTRLDPGLPLYDSKSQDAFAQCGGPHVLALMPEVATRALKAVWYQKWFIHHRLRPEEYAGRVHHTKTGAASYPLHPDVLNSRAVAETFGKYGSYLLPQAFPEGSPIHSSYGSGHATVAGACVTVLKAFFDESDIVRNPKMVNADGSALIPYEGPPLTVGGELNKVATNVVNGRNGAGVHWRTDAVNSLKLGEAVVIGILEEQKLTYNDNLEMTLTKFDGTRITI